MNPNYCQLNVHLKPDERVRLKQIAQELEMSIRKLIIGASEAYYRLNKPDPSKN